MATRVVEWKKPYTGGVAIEITKDKVINLLLREANNLLQVNGNNELYCDLQLNDELRPTDDFPVGVTTGRIVIDNGWDWEWTILCAKTTSWDNIKLVYTDAGEIWIDNWTGTFKRMYLASEVDELLALKQDLLTPWANITIQQVWDNLEISANNTEYTAGDGIDIDQNNVISNTRPWPIVSDTAPSNATVGMMWFDNINSELWIYDWTQWLQVTLTLPV